MNEQSSEYQYSIVIDILAEMIINYLAKHEIDSENERQEDVQRAS
jgi:hypothetical protein